MRFERLILVFALCMSAAFICALSFAILVRIGIPNTTTDWPYDYSIAKWLSDPFVYNGVIGGGILFGVISFPLVYFTTRNRRLKSAALGIFAVVFGEIVVVTPIAGMANLFGAPIALVLALVLCGSGSFDGKELPISQTRV